MGTSGAAPTGWSAIPPPPAYPPPGYAPPRYPPPSAPYAVRAWPAPPWQPVPAAYWQPPAPAKRTTSPVVGWIAAGMAVLVSVLSLVVPHRGPHSRTGLHAVTGVSDQLWSAEFVDSAGRPARWDPCTPISYVVNTTEAPAGGLSDVEQAFARLSAVTGMTFVNAGSTTEVGSANRSPYQPDRYGRSWAPILITWSSAVQTSLLDDPRAEAVTVPIALESASGTGGGSLVSAEVVLNVARLLPSGFGPGPSEGEVLMHELGHVVGLGHVADRGEAMYPSVRGLSAYGPGDLEGFAALGLPAGCHAAPPAHALNSVFTGTG